MKMKIFLLVFVTLVALPVIGQTTKPQHLTVENCDGEKYLVLLTDTLQSPYRDEEKWKQLLAANSGFVAFNRLNRSGQYVAQLFKDDVVCIPTGLSLGDFLETNGDISPSLVLQATVNRLWHENPVTLLAAIFVFAAFVTVTVIYRHTHPKKPVPESKDTMEPADEPRPEDTIDPYQIDGGPYDWQVRSGRTRF